MTTMRAKLEVTHVEVWNNGPERAVSSERLTFRAVCRTNGYTDTAGADEDNTYAHYSPQADLTITVANPNLFDKFTPGQKFYVDFTEAA